MEGDCLRRGPPRAALVVRVPVRRTAALRGAAVATMRRLRGPRTSRVKTSAEIGARRSSTVSSAAQRIRRANASAAIAGPP